MGSIRVLLRGVIVWALLSFCLSATAQSVLKPTDSAAIPLRTRALTADIRIDQQFAVTHLTQTFQNQTEQRTEADFLYTLPPDTIVTSFAYWCGSEKVIAHIVEKEEAAAIYASITSRMRDPALVEMVGKNTFRARIFPVMPLSDLKVEMTLIEALPSTPFGVTYRLPLRMERGQSLDSLTVHAAIGKDDALMKVANSYGLPFTEEKDSYRLTLQSNRHRPVSDLSISLFRKPNPLRAALVTSPSGRAGGYFALALTPDEAVAKPQVHLQSAKLALLASPLARLLPAHKAFYLFGRYTGEETTKVNLSGTVHNRPWTASTPLVFKTNPLKTSQNKTDQNGGSIARQLWAARQIAALSAGSSRNRTRVIAISKTYGLPSKYTSWLAVPQEEIEIYWKEKNEYQLQALVEQLVRVSKVRNMSPREERALYAQVNTLRRKLGGDSNEYMWIADNAMSMLATTLLEERNAAKIEYDYLANNRYPIIRIVPYASRRRPDPARLAFLSRQLDLLAEAFGADKREPANIIQGVEIAWWEARSWQARDELFAEERKDRPDPDRVHALEERFFHLVDPYGGHEFAENRAKTLAARADLERTERLLDLPATKADAKLTAELQQKKLALTQRYDEVRARIGDPLIQVEAPEDALQVVAVMPDGEIKRLEFNHDSRRWEARFDIPTYATEGDYRIQIMIVERDGTRRSLTFPYHVLLTPPSGTGAAHQVAEGSPTLRLEMEASENAARVSALLPWGEKVELSSTIDPHRFLAVTPVPEAYRNRTFAITFLVTDRAHNRTEIRLDPAQ